MSIYIYQVNRHTEYNNTEYNLKIFTHKWYLNIYIKTIVFGYWRICVVSKFDMLLINFAK